MDQQSKMNQGIEVSQHLYADADPDMIRQMLMLSYSNMPDLPGHVSITTRVDLAMRSGTTWELVEMDDRVVMLLSVSEPDGHNRMLIVNRQDIISVEIIWESPKPESDDDFIAVPNDLPF